MKTNRRTKNIRRAGPFLVLALLLTAPALLAQTYGDPGYGDPGYGYSGDSGYGDPGYGDSGYGDDTSYSFARVIEGTATLYEADGDRDQIELHQPLLVSDRLWVPWGSRIELVLADRGLLRLQGEAEVTFDAIAYSADTGDRETLIRLEVGELQLVVPPDFLGERPARIDTPAATVYVDRPGTYRVTASRSGWSELVVRDGSAEMVSREGAIRVYGGDLAVAESGYRPRLDVRRAGGRDDLERWGDRLSYEAASYDVPYVDSRLRYAAAPLARYGGWVSIGGRHAWRPRLTVEWRPYSNGYWRTTPIGYTWVSYDPWGWVTHHHGDWDYAPGYGWVWYPSYGYSPARVHWYWGPDYVGWCPSGYYARYYGSHHSGHGLHFGIYGYAGGSWDLFAHWSFSAILHFGGRGQRGHVHSGEYLASHHTPNLARGIITNDPGRGHRRPNDVYDTLRERTVQRARTLGRELPDVGDFVARKPLRDDVERTILRPREDIRREVQTAVRERQSAVRRELGRPELGREASSRRVETKPLALERRTPTVDRTPDRTPRGSIDERRDDIRREFERREDVTRERPTVTRERTERPEVTRERPTVTREHYERPEVTRERPTVTRERYERPEVTRERPTVTRERYERPEVTRERPTVTRERYERPEVTRERPTVTRERYERPEVTRERPTVEPRRESSPEPRAAPSRTSERVESVRRERSESRSSKPSSSRVERKPKKDNRKRGG